MEDRGECATCAKPEGDFFTGKQAGNCHWSDRRSYGTLDPQRDGVVVKAVGDGGRWEQNVAGGCDALESKVHGLVTSEDGTVNERHAATGGDHGSVMVVA